jgi:hypothetical protein
LKLRDLTGLIAGFLLANQIIVGVAWAAVSSFAGSYNGTGRAAGMALVIEQEDDRVYGRVVDGQSNVFQLTGTVNGNAIQGTLYNPSSAANFQLELRPSGLQFVIIPLVDGRPELSAMKRLVFERGRVTHPALADYRVPAPRAGALVDVMTFLGNYRSWTKDEVAIGYGGVPARDRATINGYDHLQTDIMVRLCRANAAPAEISVISQRQALGCPQLIALFDRADDAGVLDRFRDMAEFQRGALYTKLACERNLYPASRCIGSAQFSNAAAPAWQSAEKIFADLQAAKGRLSLSAPASVAPPQLPYSSLGANNSRAALIAAAPAPQPKPAPPPQGGPAKPVLAVPQRDEPVKAMPAARQMPRERDLTAARREAIASAVSGLDMTLRPSVGRRGDAEPDRFDPQGPLLQRVRAKMRERPVPPRAALAPDEARGPPNAPAANLPGVTRKIPNPRPRPRLSG